MKRRHQRTTRPRPQPPPAAADQEFHEETARADSVAQGMAATVAGMHAVERAVAAMAGGLGAAAAPAPAAAGPRRDPVEEAEEAVARSLGGGGGPADVNRTPDL